MIPNHNPMINDSFYFKQKTESVMIFESFKIVIHDSVLPRPRQLSVQIESFSSRPRKRHCIDAEKKHIVNNHIQFEQYCMDLYTH